jgi:hypothetical protein
VGGRRGEVVKTMYTRVSKCKNNKNKIKKKKKKNPLKISEQNRM